MARTNQTASKSTGGEAPAASVLRRAAARKVAPEAAPKTRRTKPGVVAVREIRKYQKSTELLIQKAPFARLAREIVQDMDVGALRWRVEALNALQENAEAYLVRILHDANLCARHAGRQTVIQKDFWLAMRLNGAEEGELYGIAPSGIGRRSFSKHAFTAAEDAARRSRAM